MKSDKKVVKFHKAFQINIGLVIFGIIIIYVMFHVFSFLTSDTLTVYEVTEGTISDDTSYKALAIRKEEVVTASSSGDLFYYAPNLDQVGVRTNIYSVDNSGVITEKLKQNTSDLNVISNTDINKLTDEMVDFVTNYNGDNFQRVYGFKTNLSSDLIQYYSNTMVREIEGEISQAQQQGQFSFYQPSTTGVVVYQTDGMEDVSLENFSADSFDASKLEIINLKNRDNIKKGEVAYKLITSDHWNLVMEIDETLAKRIQDEEMTYIQICFLEDNVTTWAACQIEKKDNVTYLVLSLDDGVARYANSRFVHISLLFDEQTGLKIPNSAIVEKEFFTVPKAYFFKGNDSDNAGIMVKNEKGSAELVIPTIYYETDDYYYIDSEKVSATDVILKPDASDTYTIGSNTATLKGVYNVNKGYAVFKQIHIIYQNEDYAIISKGTTYGIANYDHIALQGNLIKENDLINK